MTILYTWNNMPPVVAVTCPKCNGEAEFTFGSNPDNPKMGSLKCNGLNGDCDLDQTHQLRWPQQAYYAISYRTNKLWAFDKDCAQDLRDFIASTERKVENHAWQDFLITVPKPFLLAPARNSVVNKLDKVMARDAAKPA